MKALLLAAGLGTRLRPVTNYIPKCLVPINGKPLLGYWLDSLPKAGVDEFIVNTNYLSHQVEEFVKDSVYRDKVTLVYEEELLLTGGTVLANREFFKDEAFVVVHADNLSFCDFAKFIEAHRDRPERCEMTMMTFQTDTPRSCGVVATDERGVVTGFYEKVESPPTDIANAAVYIFEPSIFEFLESLQKKKIDLSTEVIPEFVGKICIFHNDIYHRDIGTLESYGLSQVEVLRYV